MKNHLKKIKISSKWLEFAEEDFKTAFLLWETNSFLYRIICYHSQQYVEKVLKGLLEGFSKNPPRIHDINALAIRCEQLGIKVPLSEEEKYFLSSIYIDTRYPPDIGLIPGGEPGKQEAQICITILNNIKTWIEQSTISI